MSDPATADPYARTDADRRDPPRSWPSALRQIGPGLILAGAIVGTGELIATTRLGAKEGYAFLWLILLSCVIKVFLQTELGRYAITHGKTTLAAFDTLPGPRLRVHPLCWLWLLMMLATQAQIAAMEGLVGQAAHMAFPGAARGVASIPLVGPSLAAKPDVSWAALTGLAAVALLLSGGYSRLEHVTTTLVAFVTAITVACVVGLPWTGDPIRASDLAGGLTFSIPGTAGVALAFSTFGITGVGAAELFAYPYWCIEKGYARYAGPRPPVGTPEGDDWGRRARGWLGVMRLDAWFSMVVFTLATVAFYLLGAAVLHPRGQMPEGASMIATLSEMYVRPLGAWTREVFLVGAWAVLFKTLYVATAANSRLTGDFLDLAGLWRQPTPARRSLVTRVFCVVYPLLAFGLYVGLREPGRLVTIGGYAQGLLLPLIAAATLYLRYRDADPRVAPSKFADAMTWIASVAIALVAAYSIVDGIRGLRG